jgi:hypothetical protein
MNGDRPSRPPLSLDQQRVLDEVARLALLGYDARPSSVAQALNLSLERVTVALEELCAFGLVLGSGGRVPRC